jgi:hypothetical protein
MKKYLYSLLFLPFIAQSQVNQINIITFSGDTLKGYLVDEDDSFLFYKAERKEQSIISLKLSSIKKIEYPEENSKDFDTLIESNDEATQLNYLKHQITYKDIRKEIKSLDTVIWFGLDFSNARLIGDFNNKGEINNSYLFTWNSNIIGMNLLKSYRLKPFIYDFSVIKTRNSHIPNEVLFSSIRQNLTSEKIQQIVAHYQPAIKHGKGIVLIVEYFNTELYKASIWFVYFDVKTKNVIYCERKTTFAQEDEMLKCWDRAINNIIDGVDYMHSQRKYESNIILSRSVENIFEDFIFNLIDNILFHRH